MIISIIAAVDEGGGIGIKNKIPWHLPADLKRFKTITMGHHLVMGRKTYLARDAGEKEVFIVGGAEVYSQALPLADHIYLTRVHCRQEADTYFPNLNNADWTGICSQFHPGDEKNPYPHTFIHYIRSRSE